MAATGKGRNSSRSPQQVAGNVANGLGRAVTQTAAQAREGAEDLVADARAVAHGSGGRDAVVYTGLGAATVVGMVGWPVAALAGAGYAVARRVR